MRTVLPTKPYQLVPNFTAYIAAKKLAEYNELVLLDTALEVLEETQPVLQRLLGKTLHCRNWKAEKILPLANWRAMSLRHHLPVGDIVAILVEIFQRILPQLFQPKNGVPLALLTGQRAWEILDVEITRLYPDRENFKAWHSEQRLQATFTSGAVDYCQSGEEGVSTRRKLRTIQHWVALRKSALRKRPYRGNPWL